MEWFFKISNSIRHGKLLTLVKPLLNIIFISGVTFSIMNCVYHPIVLPSQFQLNEILSYFLKGDFIIPFGIFFLLWAFSSYLFETIFQFFNMAFTEKFRKKLLDFSFLKSFGSYIDDAEKNKVLALAKTPKKDWAFKIYDSFKKELDEKKMKELNQRLRQSQSDFMSDFVLLFRSMIAISIYFVNVPEFGWLLFSLLLIVQIIMGFLLIFGYQLSVLIPIVMIKFNREYEQHKRMEKLINPTS